MKRIFIFAALLLSAAVGFGQSKVMPKDIIMDEAVTLDKGGACYAFKLNGEKAASFFPACVFFTNQGLVIGVGEEPDHYDGHVIGGKTNYFFYPNSEVNKAALHKLGLTARIGVLFENGQWNVVSILPEKTGSGNHVAITPIAGKVTTKTINDSVYKKKMAPDLWKPETRLVGAILMGIYGRGAFPWPFSLYSAANQK
jgi:hypothetical protein